MNESTEFSVGDICTKTDIFLVNHWVHRLPHHVLITAGTIFPLCNVCGHRARFQPLNVAIPFEVISIFKDIDFSSGQNSQSDVVRDTLPQARILLVEDYKPWREIIRGVVQECSDLIIVGEASDGVQAVQKARELKPDMILLDIGLPSRNGFQAAIEIKEFLPETKIIFVTLHADAAWVRAAMCIGVQGFVLKIDVRRELLECIDTVLRDRRYISRGLPKDL